MYGYLSVCNNLVPSLCSYLGVTPPIATHESSQREKEVTVTLMEELRRQNTFESAEESRTRYVTSSTNNVACRCQSHPCYTNFPHQALCRFGTMRQYTHPKLIILLRKQSIDYSELLANVRRTSTGRLFLGVCLHS